MNGLTIQSHSRWSARVRYPPARWSDYSQRIIDRLQLKKTGSEWHGACPNCGGTDRFWIRELRGDVKIFCGEGGRSGCNDYKAIMEAMREMNIWPAVEHDEPRLARHEPPPAQHAPAHLPQGWTTPYHIMKRLQLTSARLENGTVVIVPLYTVDSKGIPVGEQRIAPGVKIGEYEKRFSPGLKKEGAFAVCGQLGVAGSAYIAEGWATAGSVWEATGIPCVFAADAGNLPKVVQDLHRRFPRLNLTVAADNDEAGIKCAKKTGLPYVAPRNPGDDWSNVWLDSGAKGVIEQIQRVTPALFSQVGKLRVTRPDWLIASALERETLGMVFGPSGAGKTFVVLDMALSIATGTAWADRETKQGTVFYLAGEGHGGFARRVQAWASARGVDVSTAPCYKSSRPIILSDEADVGILRDAIDQMRDAVGLPALIIVDTLARALGSADEKNGADINPLIAALDAMKADYGCSVLLVHHTGHSNKDRARGASEIHAALDHEFRVEADGDNHVLVTATKQKDDSLGHPMRFAKESRPVTDDPLDDDLRSLAMVYDGLDEPAGDDEYHKEAVVVREYNRLSTAGRLTRPRLRDDVATELGVAARSAQRAIKQAIDKGVIDL